MESKEKQIKSFIGLLTVQVAKVLQAATVELIEIRAAATFFHRLVV